MLASICWSAIGVALLIIGIVGIIIVVAKRAPTGYEDDDGFHKHD